MQCKMGVDVSKKKLDVALLLPEGKWRSKVFSNDPAGLSGLLDWIALHVPGGVAAVHVCLEATGAYHENLALFLHDRQVHVSVVNPLQVKRFMEASKVRNKTDAGDAKAIALFCDKTQPALWEAPTVAVRTLQALVLRLDALNEMRQGELNRLEVAHESVKASLRDVIANLQRAIEEVTNKIKQTIDDDPELRQRDDLLQSIPGLGDKTIPRLLAYIGRPERFACVKALIAYASLCPVVRQSGTSLDKHRGTHPQGHHGLKHALYFPAMVAGRHNPLIRTFWQRLQAQNKPGKVIVVACMHKLLAIVYGVLKTKTPFNVTHPAPAAS